MEFKKYTKDSRSSFGYWFNHWLAYNYTAWKLGVWKPKWLLHDIEKPWLKLIWNDYHKVQQWHRMNNSHHVHYGRKYGYNKIDWLAVVIDWECSRLTKLQAPRTAREETEYIIANNTETKFSKDEVEEIRKNCLPIVDFLGI